MLLLFFWGDFNYLIKSLIQGSSRVNHMLNQSTSTWWADERGSLWPPCPHSGRANNDHYFELSGIGGINIRFQKVRHKPVGLSPKEEDKSKSGLTSIKI